MRVIPGRRGKGSESRSTFLSDNTAHEVIVGVIASVLVSVFSFLGTFLASALSSHSQYLHEVQTQSVKDAQFAAAESIKLLFQSQNELHALANAAEKKEYPWKEFNHEELSKYLTYFREWRHDMILSHFRIRQYFGKDAADRLVNLDDELNSKLDYLDGELRPKQELKPTRYKQQAQISICGRGKNLSLLQIAEHLECQIRMYSATINNPDFTKYLDDEKGNEALFEIIDMEISSSRAIAKNFEVYDLNTLSFVQAINSRLQAIERESGIPTYEFKLRD